MSHKSCVLTLGWAAGVDATPHPPNRISSFSWEWEELLFQTNFLAVVSFLGHLSMKIFQIGPTVLALKLDKGRVLRGWRPFPMDFFTYFSNHEDDIQCKQILIWSRILPR